MFSCSQLTDSIFFTKHAAWNGPLGGLISCRVHFQGVSHLVSECESWSCSQMDGWWCSRKTPHPHWWKTGKGNDYQCLSLNGWRRCYCDCGFLSKSAHLTWNDRAHWEQKQGMRCGMESLPDMIIKLNCQVVSLNKAEWNHTHHSKSFTFVKKSKLKRWNLWQKHLLFHKHIPEGIPQCVIFIMHHKGDTSLISTISLDLEHITNKQLHTKWRHPHLLWDQWVWELFHR